MNDVEALSEVLAILKQIDKEGQTRVLQSVNAFLGIQTATNHSSTSQVSLPSISSQLSSAHFSTDRSLSPKDLLRQKQPATDVERIACLAYYLTHYRETPHFTTLEISALNTEAALPKFSNASFSVNNATNMGYLVAAAKGTKQLSSGGERFVELLPDREAARAALKCLKPRRINTKKSNSKRL